MKRILVSILFVCLFAQFAMADICDYRPTKIMGDGTTGAAAAAGVAGSSGAVAATGITMKAAGLYTITHATTGATMLGSTAAGASAAGTTGIIAGTSGFVGTVGAVLMSPFVIIPAIVVTTGIAVYEGGCYLAE
jgi:hypothetical protein